MISIKKLLSADKEIETASIQAIRILIHGIGEHAAAGETDVVARFEESIQEILGVLEEDLTPGQLLAQANSAVSVLEGHNRRTARYRSLQTVELQKTVAMLLSTVRIISAAGDAHVNRLGDLGNQIATASVVDEVRSINDLLGHCLADIRIESECQRKETRETIEGLNRELEGTRKTAAGIVVSMVLDEVTGVPKRADAEATLARASREGSEVYAAVFVLDRLQAFNLRFGREVGDQVLTALTGMIRKQLKAGDLLYRWSGPTLVALLPRATRIERARSEIARIVETKLEHTVQLSNRTISLPIAARWSVFPMMAAPRLLFQKIDAFAAAPTSRD